VAGPGCATCGAYGDVLEAFCGVIDRCEDAVYPIAYRNRAECVRILAWATTCRLEDDEVNDVRLYRLEQKVPVVDGPKARACIDWLKTASCEQVARMNRSTGEADGGAAANPCEGAFRTPDDDDDRSSGQPPAAAAGQPCRSGDQSSCQRGLYCTAPLFSPATNQESCPVCAPLPTAGQPCGSGYHCAPGLYCKAKDPRMHDQGGTCVPPEPDGGECLSAEQCASGFCRRPSGGLGTCDPGGTVGAACAARADCRHPLICNPQTMKCESLRPLGGPCTADAQCANGRCDTAAGACGLADGATCRSASDCRSGYCNESTRVCGSRKPVGEACTSSGECETNDCRNRVCFERCGSDRPCPAGQFCDPRTQQCRSPGADGARCDDDDECQSGWCSPDDRCAKKPQLGDKCTRSSSCYPLGYCVGGVCVKRKGPGASCDALDSCREPFLCRRGKCELINLSCKPAEKGEMCAKLRV
jgi:hypothetical protein